MARTWFASSWATATGPMKLSLRTGIFPGLPRAPFYMRVVPANMLRLSLSSASGGLSLPPIKWPFYLPLHCLSYRSWV